MMKTPENIILFTGKIHTGKSTALETAIKGRTDTDGIISPVIENKRYIRRISTGETHLLDADEQFPENEIITAGRYRFRKDVFLWARNQLHSMEDSEAGLIIIDEIGFLELEGTGLEPEAGILVRERIENNKKLLLVIRDTLINSVINYYGIINKPYTVISEKESLKNLFGFIQNLP